jgi:type II restriction/modification system DNA methylase subunit YeeA
MRHVPTGYVFETKGNMCFFETEQQLLQGLGFCNSCIVNPLIQCVSPTLDFHAGPVGKLPIAADINPGVIDVSKKAVRLAETDWNAYERSWDFQSLPLLTTSSDPIPTLESSYTAWIAQNRDTIVEMKRLEEENNRLFIDTYGLQDELTPEVPIEQVTLTVNPAYRYGTKLTEEERRTRFREDTMQELVSYAIGCTMGRYSLDEPGLIYAHSGNEGFDPNKYTTFPADEDGIIPLTDTDWFEDDAAHRLIGFISVAWVKAHLEENLRFLADNLSPKKNESPRDTIRRYLCDSFFKDHLQTYKKRPIYWLFSSGKQKAFQCLVYLHRYNEGTLARMRSEYVIPLQGKMAARLDQLQGDIQSASSTVHSKRLEKERDKLEKQQAELLTFDEKLRHYADRRIHLDLDDGVKVNYGKFGDLLAEVKAVHGEKPGGA